MFSVLLSVYRQEDPRFLEMALDSIYNAQILKPDQIVLVQDGELTAELHAVCVRWKERLEHVVTIVPLEENVGLGAALNEGLKHCNYELIARMDADDISLPDRFQKQVAFMLSNPDVAASSALLQEFNSDFSVSHGVRFVPVRHVDIVRFGKRRSPLNHIPAIFRKSVIEHVGGYPPLRNAQDYALWSLLIVKGYTLANLPEVLAHIRAGSGLIERRGFSYLKHEVQLLRFQRRIGFLNFGEYMVNLIMRSATRLSPAFIKRMLYKQARY